MSKTDKAKKRYTRKSGRAKAAVPRMIGANDNHANDNASPVLVSGLELTGGRAMRFHVATARIASDSIQTQRAGHQMMAELEREIAELLQRREVDQGLDETRDLERLRGNEIVASKTQGARDAPEITRDGLKSLTRPYTDRDTGISITPIDPGSTTYAALLRYRADYERMDPERGLTPPAIDPSQVRGSHGGATWEDKRRESARRVFCIHLMICGIQPSPTGRGESMPILPREHPAARAIRALEDIAGKGRMIRDMASSGSVRTRIKEDLLRAADTCEIVYGLA
ncbi:MAG: hypothetical protein V7672_00795 [Brevundimonas sp.]|uniref:hypothetical protein n=1 Tax=Brevundimonas sp. TaxID=1871086 RepID=UPI003002271D